MQRSRGFIMADTLVALMIVSLIAVSLVTLLSYNRTMADRAKTKLTASLLMNSLILEGQETGQGEEVIEGTTYQWVTQYSVGDDRNLDRVRRGKLNVIVSWRSGGQPQRLSLSMTRLVARNE